MNPNSIPLKEFINFSEAHGCKCSRIHKGHDIYRHPKATQPAIIQDHIDPVPLMVVKF